MVGLMRLTAFDPAAAADALKTTPLAHHSRSKILAVRRHLPFVRRSRLNPRARHTASSARQIAPKPREPRWQGRQSTSSPALTAHQLDSPCVALKSRKATMCASGEPQKNISSEGLRNAGSSDLKPRPVSPMTIVVVGPRWRSSRSAGKLA